MLNALLPPPAGPTFNVAPLPINVPAAPKPIELQEYGPEIAPPFNVTVKPVIFTVSVATGIIPPFQVAPSPQKPLVTATFAAPLTVHS